MALVLTAAALRLWVVEPVRVLTSSMAPTLQAGDVVLVWRLGSPGVGDVVLAKEPGDEGRRHLKRLVAGAGQEVELAQGRLYVDGSAVASSVPPETLAWIDTDCRDRSDEAIEEQGRGQRWQVFPGGGHLRERVAEGGVWLLGDNRGGSSDSRHWGPVARPSLLGSVRAVVWSRSPCGGLRLDRIGLVAEGLGGTGDESAR